MDRIFLTISGIRFTGTDLTLAGLGLTCFLLLIVTVSVLRAGRARALAAEAQAERQHELDDKMAELTRINSELTGRLSSVAEAMSSRQSDLVRLLADRLDAVGTRVGQSLETGSRSTVEQLARLGERLAVIDRAQARLSDLTGEVVGLKDILSNKQSRGAFGQGRMEAIVRDGLPAGAFDFQPTLSNRNRPDCVIRLPGDDRLMVIDAKFPLEAFTALREAKAPEERRAAQARVRADVGKHVKDIAERYFIPGETQDLALMFVPSESIHADLHEHFEDVVQKAHRGRILIVSPSLLMLAIQVLQSVVRDARMQEQAHLIQNEVRLLLADVTRLRERSMRLEVHLRQAQEDAGGLNVSIEKISRRGEKIDQLEFSSPTEPVTPPDLFRAAE